MQGVDKLRAKASAVTHDRNPANKAPPGMTAAQVGRSFADNARMQPASRMLEQLIYLSQARAGLDATDVRAILGTAQVKNRRRDVTGLLLYSGQHFIQVLEGRPAHLEELVGTIRSDARHSGVQVVVREPVQQRRYGSWAMEYVESMDVADELKALYDAGSATAASVEDILARAPFPS